MHHRHRRIVALSAALWITSTLSLSAQTSIAQADVEGLAGKFQVSYPATSAPGFDLSVSGPNRSWDLSSFTFGGTPDLIVTHFSFPPPGGPDVGNPAFSQCNYATRSESDGATTWQYAKVSSSGVEVLGNVDTASFALAPGLKIMGAFPVTSGSSWSSVSTVTSPVIPSGFSAHITASGSIDSWGTMTLPSGAGGTLQLNVLRLKLSQTTTIKLGTFVIYEFSSVDYQWLSSPSEGQFYVARASTDSLGGLKRLSYYTPFDVEPVGVTSERSTVPPGVMLRQNYPNPFNPSTTIAFELPRSGYVLLSVTNALGQPVAELVHGVLEAGSHAVRFEGRELPSGTYFCRLQFEGAIQTLKMILMK